jgi:cell division septation protein DedD
MRRLMAMALAAAAAVLAAGCGGQTSVSGETAETAETAEQPRAYGDLPGYDGDPFAGFGAVVSVDLPAEPAEDDSAQTQEEAGEAEAGSGPFSIQIMALGDEATARGVAESASEESGLPAHVDLEGGYWKVRLGSFSGRSEAAGNLPLVVDLGFEDAWVVRRAEG